MLQTVHSMMAVPYVYMLVYHVPSSHQLHMDSAHTSHSAHTTHRAHQPSLGQQPLRVLLAEIHHRGLSQLYSY